MHAAPTHPPIRPGTREPDAAGACAAAASIACAVVKPPRRTKAAAAHKAPRPGFGPRGPDGLVPHAHAHRAPRVGQSPRWQADCTFALAPPHGVHPVHTPALPYAIGQTHGRRARPRPRPKSATAELTARGHAKPPIRSEPAAPHHLAPSERPAAILLPLRLGAGCCRVPCPVPCATQPSQPGVVVVRAYRQTAPPVHGEPRCDLLVGGACCLTPQACCQRLSVPTLVLLPPSLKRVCAGGVEGGTGVVELKGCLRGVARYAALRPPKMPSFASPLPQALPPPPSMPPHAWPEAGSQLHACNLPSACALPFKHCLFTLSSSPPLP